MRATSDSVTNLKFAGWLAVRHVCGHTAWHLLPGPAEPEAAEASLRRAKCPGCEKKESECEGVDGAGGHGEAEAEREGV